MPQPTFAERISNALRDRCRVSEGDRILLAVSGGADSVALLRAMVELAKWPQWRLDLHVAHINHKLRDDADNDETFVVMLCASLNLSCHTHTLDLQNISGNLEAEARRQRYQSLAHISNGIDADFVATAHHADDQLETMLMRLIRGSTAKGLAAMAWRRGMEGTNAELIRPMLTVDHDDAVGYLREIQQDWREDSTNQDLAKWRARLRSDVLPILKELRPSAAHKAVETTDRLRNNNNNG